ncbi:SWIM-type domain-containing protein [Citrus sinensis]|nr:SWIM-type domain-containing protein [Citrus sinensis]
MVDSDSGDDVGNNNTWDAGLDDYESTDDSGLNSDMLSDDEVQDACNRYEANSGGIEFNIDGERIMLRVGAVYRNVDEFKNVVKVFAIENGFRLKRVKNEKSIITLACVAVGCTWRVHASPNWNGKHFQIKTFQPKHICARGNDNYEANSTWIAATFLHLFRANPQLNIEVIISELLRRFGIKCSNQRLYRAKNKALELLGQDHKANYTKLYRYMHAILISNPGSTVTIDRDWLGGGQNPHFQRFFVMFDANRRGFFEGCRQFIGLDDCHLKGLYKGVLLSAVSIDPNNGIYPLAMCVVESENTNSWVYFMNKLYEQIGCNNGSGLCFMSDRQRGILNALEIVFPKSLKRYCCRHIYANFKQNFPSVLLRNSFWKACRSSNLADFNTHMFELNNIHSATHDWLIQIPVCCWAKHKFPMHTKCSHMTNNMSKSFNNWINNFRGLPIVRMVEEIRKKVMNLIHRRYEQVVMCQDELPPQVRRRILDGRVKSRSMSVIFGHNDTFEVMEDVSKRKFVNLKAKECDCVEWQLSGLPYAHALYFIDAMRYNVNDFVHPLLKNEALKKTYKHQYYPMPDESRWPFELHDNMLPPIIIRTAGRPQTKRRREADENMAFKRSSSVRCSNYEEWGHNVRTCKVDKGSKK